MKEKLRRFTALCLILCICLTFAAFTAAPEENRLIWSFDETDGILTIGGVGDVPILTSPEEQPWAAFREKITEVHIDPDAQYFAENIAYWFSGCTNLVYAEVPGYWFVVGESAFEGCVNLQELVFLTIGTPVIAETAFTCEGGADLIVMVNGEEPMQAVTAYNWGSRTVDFGDFSAVQPLPYMPNGHCMNGCNCSSCSWSYAYIQRDANYHYRYPKCDNCSANEQAYGSKETHSFDASGRCTLCGYSGGSGGGGSIGPAPSCQHIHTRKTWFNPCSWEEYCADCGKYLRSGTRHGSYSYGPWEYYSSTQHRSFYACNNCGQGSYEYRNHSTTNHYASYSDTQHTVTKYCDTCKSEIGAVSYAPHNLSYGAWTSYDDNQHRRSKSCADCGFTGYDYGAHTDRNSDGLCDTCGYGMKRFSVTVPASLPLVMDAAGQIHSTEAAIVNQSTHPVQVTQVRVQSENGWTLVPYSTNMAHEKVDSRRIGLSINGAKTTKMGQGETLTLIRDWIVEDTLALTYDAVVSATSQPIRGETIGHVVFVVTWA